MQQRFFTRLLLLSVFQFLNFHFLLKGNTSSTSWRATSYKQCTTSTTTTYIWTSWYHTTSIKCTSFRSWFWSNASCKWAWSNDGSQPRPKYKTTWTGWYASANGSPRGMETARFDFYNYSYFFVVWLVFNIFLWFRIFIKGLFFHQGFRPSSWSWPKSRRPTFPCMKFRMVQKTRNTLAK